ncbi:MAG: TolB family protein [Bacteroidia bacterium]
MKKIIFFLVFSILVLPIYGQTPSTDIFLVNVTKKDGKYKFGKPVNITHRDGYDNQPSFTPDGKRILYASMPDTTQTEIYQYTIKDSTIKRITESAESEYSPVFLPGGKYISCIRVNRKKAQHLYSVPIDGKSAPEVIIDDTDSCAYYAWIDSVTLAMCILNRAMDLHVFDLATQQFGQVAEYVGRCLVKFPRTNDMCFVKNGMGEDKSIMRFTYKTGSMYSVAPALKGSEDFTIMPDGNYLMGSEGKLYMINDSLADWQEIADFSKTVGNFYRLVASPDGKRIALVSYVGKKP